MKRVLSFILAMLMLFSLLAVSAAAEEVGTAEIVSEESTGEITIDPVEAPTEETAEVTTEEPSEESTETPTEEMTGEDLPSNEMEDDLLSLDGVSGGYVSVSDDGYGAVTINGIPVTLEMVETEDNNFYRRFTPVQVAAGETVTIVATPKEGYEFRGWHIDESFNESVGGCEGTDGSYTFTMPSYSVSFSANFYRKGIITVTVHYHLRSNPEFEMEYSVLPGEPFYLEDTDTNFCYVDGERLEFVGWTVGSPEGDFLLANTYYTFDENTDLYAKYAPGVKLSFHDKNGITTRYVAKGVPVTLSSRFGGTGARVFATEPDGSGTVYEVGQTYIFYEDIDLYPGFDNSVLVTYHERDGAADDSNCVKKGSMYTLRNYYGHSGFGDSHSALQYWAVGSFDSEVHYVPGATVQINEDVALYPVLAEELVAVSFHSNDIRDRVLEKYVVAKDCDVILPMMSEEYIPQG